DGRVRNVRLLTHRGAGDVERPGPGQEPGHAKRDQLRVHVAAHGTSPGWPAETEGVQRARPARLDTAGRRVPLLPGGVIACPAEHGQPASSVPSYHLLRPCGSALSRRCSYEHGAWSWVQGSWAAVVLRYG